MEERYHRAMATQNELEEGFEDLRSLTKEADRDAAAKWRVRGLQRRKDAYKEAAAALGSPYFDLRDQILDKRAKEIEAAREYAAGGKWKPGEVAPGVYALSPKDLPKYGWDKAVHATTHDGDVFTELKGNDDPGPYDSRQGIIKKGVFLSNDEGIQKQYSRHPSKGEDALLYHVRINAERPVLIDDRRPEALAREAMDMLLGGEIDEEQYHRRLRHIDDMSHDHDMRLHKYRVGEELNPDFRATFFPTMKEDILANVNSHELIVDEGALTMDKVERRVSAHHEPLRTELVHRYPTSGKRRRRPLGGLMSGLRSIGARRGGRRGGIG